ncbi:phasin family protein [Aquibium microcysteis]|uniref:phasin family protein n=1 Tax=Aquibium microcysteis TaxID=675281 RepID=UPI00165CFD5C|nr:phasin family protein [Aquibium microcysteis]
MMNAMDPFAMKILTGAAPGTANLQKFWMSVARLQANAMRAALRYNVEALDFAKRRVEQDIKLFDDLSSSDGMKDAFDVCAGFMEGAVAQYSRETSRFASLGSKIASETADEVRREAKAVVDDMAAGTLA